MNNSRFSQAQQDNADEDAKKPEAEAEEEKPEPPTHTIQFVYDTQRDDY